MRFLKPTHALLQKWASLDQAKSRKEENLFLAEGAKIVGEALRSSWKLRALLVREDRREHFGGMPDVRSGKLDVFTLTDREWRRLSQDKSSEGIMAVVSLPLREETGRFLESMPGNLLLLHELNNPNNLGAVMRTAHWFGFTGIILSRNSVDFAHPKAVRASMGSLFDLSILDDADFEAILPRLKGRFRLIGSDVRAGALPHRCEGPTALMLGSESHGLPKELSNLADEVWRIPGSSRAESLSLPQAAAVLMYACTATA